MSIERLKNGTVRVTIESTGVTRVFQNELEAYEYILGG